MSDGASPDPTAWSRPIGAAISSSRAKPRDLTTTPLHIEVYSQTNVRPTSPDPRRERVGVRKLSLEKRQKPNALMHQSGPSRASGHYRAPTHPHGLAYPSTRTTRPSSSTATRAARCTSSRVPHLQRAIRTSRFRTSDSPQAAHVKT
jgi:hypothetical protein